MIEETCLLVSAPQKHFSTCPLVPKKILNKRKYIYYNFLNLSLCAVLWKVNSFYYSKCWLRLRLHLSFLRCVQRKQPTSLRIISKLSPEKLTNLLTQNSTNQRHLAWFLFWNFSLTLQFTEQNDWVWVEAGAEDTWFFRLKLHSSGCGIVQCYIQFQDKPWTALSLRTWPRSRRPPPPPPCPWPGRRGLSQAHRGSSPAV